MTGRTREHLGEILGEHGLLDLPAAEVGVWQGVYSAQILSWGIPVLYLIDLWGHDPTISMGGYEQEIFDEAFANCMKRVSEFDAEVRVCRGLAHEVSEQIPDGTLGFCFIDATHDYENVMRDLVSYWPKLTDGGIMAGHDYNIEGVDRAVQEFADSKNLSVHLLPVNEGDISFWLERK